MTLKDIYAAWRDYKKHFVKFSTIAAYDLIARNHLIPYFGDHETITEDDVQRYALQKVDAGLSQKTVRDTIIVLKMMLKFAAKRNAMNVNTDWDICFPRDTRKKELEVLTIAEHRKIVDHITKNFSFLNIGIYLGLCAGMRIGEICGLKFSDIDIAEGIIVVGRTIERVYDIDTGKTIVIVSTPKTENSRREIPMNKELLSMMKPMMKVVNHDFYVLTNSEKPTEPRTFRNYYHNFMKRLGMPKLKFHGLRHSFATRCIESNCDYKTVSVLLGHSNISTTLDLYVHPNKEQKRECVRKMFNKISRT